MGNEAAVLYETVEGHTGEIAGRIVGFLAEEGWKARAIRCSEAGAAGAAASAGNVLIGASIHAGKPHKKVLRFVTDHLGELQSGRSALFLVCLTAKEDSDGARQEVARYLEDFSRRTGWTPSLRTAFAGALPFTRYGFFKKQLMKAIVRRRGGEADASRDYVYTDWEAVRSFVKAFVAGAEA